MEKTLKEVQRQYENLRSKKESLRVSISNLMEKKQRLNDVLRKKEAKLKEINLRCDKLERYLYPEQKLNQTKAQRFQSLARKVLPAKLFNDLLQESSREN